MPNANGSIGWEDPWKIGIPPWPLLTSSTRSLFFGQSLDLFPSYDGVAPVGLLGLELDLSSLVARALSLIWRAWCLTVHSISQDCGAIALNYETGLSFLKASTNGLFIACFVSLALLVGLPRYGVYVAFSPVSDNVATASADRTAKLWNTDGTLVRTFEGHLDRLARIAFHPSGKYLGTTSFDKTWRLWDIESGAELLLQEGHSRSVYAISFHPDGSLLASCGLDSLTRVWDLRTGRSILALEGHIKPVYGVDFSPNGYHLATGSEDNTCRIWDLRKKKSLYIIPAHSKLISQVKFEPQEGYYLVTASYDTTVKVWSSRDFKLIRTLSGHEARVTPLDVTGGKIFSLGKL
ncbi:U4/U6 small nuclear ribonucleoprotein PRP4-like protein [Spinacia oleracea]|uniref:U4/U6 small nuclear ribonucleoprotein PRP4-like protein n=1 Tax=Spinacia oleracea TaxID=3562 RepID=A0ABM3QRB9_SPIOL|nr:U4/U6 small nuclear ribonucleoprotein PRP4-like protein [Spinacia oleracea]